MDLEIIYEINKTAHYIHTHNFTRVALQFPDELLKDSTKVVRALRDKLRKLEECNDHDGGGIPAEGRKKVGLYVMADTTYGSCCVDEVGAAHINADCVVHYGHTCMSPTSTVPAFFVFGRAPVSVADCAEKICGFASSRGKSVLVLFGLEYEYAMQELESLVNEASKVSNSTTTLKICCADALCSAVKPSKGERTCNMQPEIIANVSDHNESDGNEVFKSYSIGGLTWSLSHEQRIEDYLMFWIGSDNSAFANIVLTFNGCEIVRYDPTEKCLTTDVSQKTRVLKRRYYLVEKAKDANIVGIVVGTLGVAGYLHMIHQMKDLVTKAGKKPYLLVVGRPNPAKLANFPECDVFVYVSCAQTTLIDSKEYMAPVITPFEATLAFSRGSQWTGAYTMEFRDLIDTSASDAQSNSGEPRYSFFEGGYVEEIAHEESANDEEGLALSVATEKALRLRDENPNSLTKVTPKSGAEFLAMRSYQGLDINHDGPTPKPLLIGRTGRAAGYDDEKGQKPSV